MTEALCAHCAMGTLETPEDPEGAAGLRLCRACGRASLRGAEPSTIAGDSAPPTLRLRRVRSGRRAPGEVSSGPPALGAIVSTVLFYMVLSQLPATRVTDLFVARGWVPYVITAVASWALLLLLARAIRLRREARALDHSLVAADPEGLLHPGDCDRALRFLRDQGRHLEGTFLVERLERALRHFESRRRVVEVVDHLAAEATADEGRVDASYALVRVFVWVVPTLGFIGTVLGIGAAVGGFSETLEAAASLEGMKASIGSVTGGLGIAFDTTLLALVMSIVIMFPASAVQRAEENFLGQVDDYCAEELVRRLRDDSETDCEGDLERLAAHLARALAGTASRVD